MTVPNFTVIGDVMLDKYVFGYVERVSPESPVPVVNVDKIEYRLGGAANVAANLRCLNADVKLLGVVGNDENGKIVKTLMADKKIRSGLVTTNNRPTTIKERIVAHAQHVVRIDIETSKSIRYEVLEQVLGNLYQKNGPVIISDYNKGMVVPDIITMILERLVSENRVVVLDPKLKDFAGQLNYKGVRAIVPNHIEASKASGIKIVDDESCERAIFKLYNSTKAMSIVITRGQGGMSIFDGSQIRHIPSMAHEVYDVTGAGDTVVAVLTYFLATGYSLLEACELANKAAGIVVGKQGVSCVTLEELI